MEATETEEQTPNSGFSSNFKDTIRRETGLIEHLCEHGVGHPSYGSMDWMEKVTGDDSWGVHGCDGCCNKPDWILEDLMQAVQVSNSVILDQHEVIKELVEDLRSSEAEKSSKPSGLWVP